jgi:endonuclease YncB( thermonuclease family)
MPHRKQLISRNMRLLQQIVLPLLLLGTAAACSGEAPPPVLTGKVIKVIDADTIDVQLTSGPIRIRFHGIDVMGKEVDVEPFEQDQYERMAGIVHLGDVNINAELVQEGHAWAYRQYMRKADRTLCVDETLARISKKGLWSQSTKDRVAPWEWRRRKNLNSFTDYSSESTKNCVASIGKRIAAP